MTWHAQLDLRYSCKGVRSVVQHRHEGPLRVLKALYPEGAHVCHSVLVHPPGGIAGGGEATAGTATAPALIQNELIYQLPLYRTLITNGSTVALTDERTLTYSPTEINAKLQRILTGTDFVYAVYA